MQLTTTEIAKQRTQTTHHSSATAQCSELRERERERESAELAADLRCSCFVSASLCPTFPNDVRKWRICRTSLLPSRWLVAGSFSLSFRFRRATSVVPALACCYADSVADECHLGIRFTVYARHTAHTARKLHIYPHINK